LSSVAHEAQGALSLSDNDRALLRRLLPLAKSNEELVALGEVVEAVETIRDGGVIEEILTLSVGVQDGNDAFNEGWFIRLGLSRDAIVLDKLNTTYTREMGLERITTSFAALNPGSSLDEAGVAGWLAELNELRRWSTAEITCERFPA
jgi:hypothetical protein